MAQETQTPPTEQQAELPTLIPPPPGAEELPAGAEPTDGWDSARRANPIPEAPIVPTEFAGQKSVPLGHIALQDPKKH